MAKYRKKPVIIEAIQWFPGMELEDVCEVPNFGSVPACGLIDTLEGQMRVSSGDWIITGVKGEKYPCKPDIFAATYEPAE